VLGCLLCHEDGEILRKKERDGERIETREKFIGDKISINPIIPFIAEVR
jgi:hypothetical protein